MIRNEILKYLEELDLDLRNLLIRRIVFGLRLTAVELSDGSVGTSSTIDDVGRVPAKKDRDFDEFSPSKFVGKSVADLFGTEKNIGLIYTAKIAVLNAISSKSLRDSGYRIIYDADPIDLLEFSHGDKVTLVGAFKSYINLLTGKNVKLRVLELDEEALIGDDKKYYVPAEKYSEVIPDSDIVIITGLSLVNNTIDGLLDAVKAGTKLVITGPSAGILPQILFKKGVNIIGATEVLDSEMLFTLVSEAAAGYHLFKYCARKICILND
jgi:uncharacterized protein (DUF4213/DUF364 family)